MDTPQTLSYQLPNAIPDHLHKASVKRARRTAVILTAIGAAAIAVLLTLVLLAGTSETTNPAPTEYPSQTTTATAQPTY
ncbi:hypothetical protein NHF46_11640 [Arthrobacter alpinus]|nr:hypothetical protein [Arthrobacter alpinus]